MKYLIPNFAFEDELSCPNGEPNNRTLRAVHEFSPLFGLAGDPGDRVIVGKGALPDDVPACLQHVQFVEVAGDEPPKTLAGIVPWGWSDKARNIAIAHGASSEAMPAITAVREVNSREFNAPFDVVLGGDSTPIDLQFGQLCHSMDDVRKFVRRIQQCGDGRWVAKPQISHAGRNRLLVTREKLNSQQNGWLNKHLPDGVCLEPWVRPLEEFSLQFDIPAVNSNSAEPQLLGATQLLNDGAGRYAGNVLLTLDEVPCLSAMAMHGRQVCQAVQASGYFGPIGIDGFRFVDANGTEGFRVCNDINARFTMGRLAIHLRHHLSSGENGAWCQFAQRNASRSPDEEPDPQEIAEKILVLGGVQNVEIVRTSPISIGNVPVRTTTLLLKGAAIKDIMNAQNVLQENY